MLTGFVTFCRVFEPNVKLGPVIVIADLDGRIVSSLQLGAEEKKMFNLLFLLCRTRPRHAFLLFEAE